MDAQVLIIGEGIAGSAAALGLADRGVPVVIVSASKNMKDTASFHAQGGIVYRGEGDSARALTRDIQIAGASCGNPEMIRLIAEEGPGAVDRLLFRRLEVNFDRTPGGRLSMTMEAAHSYSRIIHHSDSTGAAIMKGLQAATSEHPLITRRSGCTALDLLNSDDGCGGAEIINAQGIIEDVNAFITILATGGAGSLFQRTSNPAGAIGDGVAIAARAGAELKNMEYVQFHPTALSLPEIDSFLISEAVRGAGARLVTPDNIPFMEKYSPEWKDLAPRDVVSRAIYEEMRQKGLSHVFLNFYDYLPKQQIIERFPAISGTCMQYGIDITKELLPVAPAAHFLCGGIAVNDQAETSLPGLYAIGECSCTGIHGANRLASTSLLEGVVWAERAAANIAGKIHSGGIRTMPVQSRRHNSKIYPVKELAPEICRMESRVKRIMWEKAGIVRTPQLLEEAMNELQELKGRAEDLYNLNPPDFKIASLRNMTSAALLIAEAAFQNRISRGCHFVVL